MVKISARKEKNLDFWISRPGMQKLGMMLDPDPDLYRLIVIHNFWSA